MELLICDVCNETINLISLIRYMLSSFFLKYTSRAPHFVGEGG